MTFRPSGYLGWCSTGATNVAEPLDSKKAVGWAVGEFPPSSYFNWLLQKQDAYLQYLDWKANASKVIEDDFCRPSGAGSSGLMFVAGEHFRIDLSSQANASVGGGVGPAIGILNLNNNITGYAFLLGSAAPPRGRDFRLEIIQQTTDHGRTGTTWQFGFPDQFAWMSTSSTGTLGFRYLPSGAASPTSFQFSGMTGVQPVSSGWRKLVAEGMGATLILSINDARVLTLPNTVFGNSGIDSPIGVRHTYIGGAGSEMAQAYIDRIEYAVKR